MTTSISVIVYLLLLANLLLVCTVGLALVRLGATADLIEYDIGLDRDIDRVTLDLRQSKEEPESTTAASTEDQVE